MRDSRSHPIISFFPPLSPVRAQEIGLSLSFSCDRLQLQIALSTVTSSEIHRCPSPWRVESVRGNNRANSRQNQIKSAPLRFRAKTINAGNRALWLRFNSGQWAGTVVCWLSPTDKAKAHDVIEKKAHKRFILPRSRFGEISNTSGLLPFPEEKKELILKIERKKWAWDFNHFLCEAAGKSSPRTILTKASLGQKVTNFEYLCACIHGLNNLMLSLNS